MGEHCPEPGVYANVEAAEYFSWDAVSNSRLSLMNKSPRHYQAGGNIKETKAMRFGSLAHLATLQPLEIADHYAVMPAYHLDEANQTKDGDPSTATTTVYVKRKVADFTAANSRRQIVTQEEFDRARLLCESIAGNQDARDCLAGAGPVEVSLVWDDPETGIRCKARLDKVLSAERRLVDLKTTGNLFKFSRSIEDYGYHRQMAHYQEGWSVLHGGELLEPWLVPVESGKPFCVQPAPVDAESLQQGHKERDRLLGRVAECVESGEWPGPESPEAWRLPERAFDPVTVTIGGVEVEI